MNFLTAWKQVALNRLESANNRIKGGQTSFYSLSFHFNQGQASIFSRSVPVYILGQTHYKMISCNIWLPVVIHRSKTRNNALDVFWGIETIIMPLSRQPQKKSFCPVSHSLAPTFMKIFFIMRLPCL